MALPLPPELSMWVHEMQSRQLHAFHTLTRSEERVSEGAVSGHQPTSLASRHVSQQSVAQAAGELSTELVPLGAPTSQSVSQSRTGSRRRPRLPEPFSMRCRMPTDAVTYLLTFSSSRHLAPPSSSPACARRLPTRR